MADFLDGSSQNYGALPKPEATGVDIISSGSFRCGGTTRQAEPGCGRAGSCPYAGLGIVREEAVRLS